MNIEEFRKDFHSILDKYGITQYKLSINNPSPGAREIEISAVKNLHCFVISSYSDLVENSYEIQDEYKRKVNADWQAKIKKVKKK